MKKFILYTAAIFLLNILLPNSVYCQKIRAVNNNVSSLLASQGKYHDLYKFSVFSSISKGTSVSFSYGLWNDHAALQYSLNTGFMWRLGKGFLGNYRNGSQPKDPRTKSQFVFMFSPMLSVKISRKDYVYQELEPFYYGTSNAVFCKYRSSVTLGSTFTISPRGTYRNVTTTRNRAQQDFMISVNLKDFNFTLYDDYFPVFTELLQLGDNWDRFFTGGGFIRYRFNDQVKLHLYSEVYTGINRANAFLYPDLIGYRKKGRKWLRKNYAFQDPGQEYFNNSWFIAKVSYTSPQQQNPNPGIYAPEMDFFIGTSRPWTMFSQNVIHSQISYDDENKMKLHFFIPRTNVPGNLESGSLNKFKDFTRSLFLGSGISYNIINL